MKSNIMVYVCLLCGILLVMSWIASAGRASPGVVHEKPANATVPFHGDRGFTHCGEFGCCTISCGCCSSAEEAKAYAEKTAKP